MTTEFTPPPPPKNLIDGRDGGARGVVALLFFVFAAALFIVPNNSAQAQTACDAATEVDIDGNCFPKTGDVDNTAATCTALGGEVFAGILCRKYASANESTSCVIGSADCKRDFRRIVDCNAENKVFARNSLAGGETSYCGDSCGAMEAKGPECVAAASVNECDTRSNECHAMASCNDLNRQAVNTADELCTCDDETHAGDGTAGPGEGTGCTPTDVDECALETDNCHDDALCANTDGSFTCACKDGFTGDGILELDGGTGCADINECDDGTHSCGGNQCTNTKGGHRCAGNVQCGENGERDPATNTCDCDAGWTGDVCNDDADECSDGTHTCGGNACFNTLPPERFTCAPDIVCVNGERIPVNNTCDCGAGWEGTTCARDIDECATNRHNCDANAVCADTDGSFTCECSSGYNGDGVLASAGGTGCTPDPNDECSPNPCGANTECDDPTPTATNTGDYVCSCGDGFSGTTTTGSPASCANINECDLQTDNCHADAVCTDTEGGFTCACKDGFTGDGVANCNVIPNNECASDPCGPNTECDDPNPTAINTGDYVCSCKSGFSGTTTTGGPASCANIDECDLQTDNCHDDAVCTDTVGSFSCNCKDGFSGDGVSSCVPIPNDECSPNPCGANTVCRDPNPVATNTGDYVCSCGDGFSGTTTTGSPATCTDVDECATGTDTCGDAEKCRNTAGSFACDRLPEVWIVAPAGEMFRAAPESGCEIRKWTESCDGRDAALSDCTPDGEGMVTVGVVFDCGN